MKFTNQARFHPRLYANELANIFCAQGGRIYEKSQVHKIALNGDRCQAVLENGINVTANDIVIATHLPLQGNYAEKTKAFRGYVLAGQADELDGMFISAERPTRSVRSAKWENKHVVMIGGEGHQVGKEYYHKSRFENLMEYGEKYFGIKEFAWRWSTQDYGSSDHVPFIGKLDETTNHIWVATAFNSWGMTQGTIAGMLLADLIAGKKNSWTELYDSTRRMSFAHMAQNFIKNNANDLRIIATGKLQFGEDISEIDRLKKGEGNIFDKGGEKLAVYRTEDDELKVLSATCTHVGCCVHFNPEEKEWDCACHGSVFNLDGEVIQGPARKNLEEKKL
jgi:Rieske Fe-S protein